MDVMGELLLRASASMALLYALYWFLLRESTHFRANRFFLLISLVISVVIAAIPVQYQVNIQAAANSTAQEFNGVFNHNIENTKTDIKQSISLVSVLYLIYLAGAAIVLLRLLIQCRKPILIIAKSKPKKINNCLIHENKVYNSPFSFFNRILINPEYFKQNEINDILTHEKVHIQERHWIDLFIIELLTVFFWFNPFIWLFERAIKQNHEYLADEGVLTRGHSPVRYQALLINRLMGTQVIGMANHFSAAQGPTRFKMMTKKKTAKRKLFRMTWGIPVLAILLVAFAEPEYIANTDKEVDAVKMESSIIENGNNAQKKLNITTKDDNNTTVHQILSKVTTIIGKVTDEKGNALPGAAIVIRGTSIGTVADWDGSFELNYSPKSNDFKLIVSFVGFKTESSHVKISKNKSNVLEYDFKMKRGVVYIDSKTMHLDGDVPPPPPPPAPDNIKPGFLIVEEMPQYNQGHYGLVQFVNKQKSKLHNKFGKKLSGTATVGFTINANGEVSNIQILDKSNNIAAKAAKIIASNMEKWKPGSQRGKKVPVDFAMELEF